MVRRVAEGLIYLAIILFMFDVNVILRNIHQAFLYENKKLIYHNL